MEVHAYDWRAAWCHPLRKSTDLQSKANSDLTSRLPEPAMGTTTVNLSPRDATTFHVELSGGTPGSSNSHAEWETTTCSDCWTGSHTRLGSCRMLGNESAPTAHGDQHYSQFELESSAVAAGLQEWLPVMQPQAASMTNKEATEDMNPRCLLRHQRQPVSVNASLQHRREKPVPSGVHDVHANTDVLTAEETRTLTTARYKTVGNRAPRTIVHTKKCIEHQEEGIAETTEEKETQNEVAYIRSKTRSPELQVGRAGVIMLGCSSNGELAALATRFPTNGGSGDENLSTVMSTKKRRLTNEQVRSLETCFERESKLEADRKRELAMELGLQPRQVAVWFQNRRARFKTKQLERDFDILKLQFDAVRSEKEKLLAQVQRLKSLLDAKLARRRLKSLI